jgi:hypothetical protein
MSYEHTPPSLDDTQPTRPVAAPQKASRYSEPAAEPVVESHVEYGDRPPRTAGRAGCGMMGLIGGLLLLFSILIVALAGAAGWTSGQREANIHLTSTQNAAISEQVNRIPGDVEAGNIVLLEARIRFLATLTPGVPFVAEYQSTATALYLNQLPTETPTASPTFTPSPTQPEPEATQEIVITPSSSGGYDLAAILQEAQAAVDTARYSEAIDLLDVIMAIDPAFQTTQVTQLMRRALNSYALSLYNQMQPAAANVIAGRAAELGLIDGNIEYERYAANLYLSARAGAPLGDPNAIAALNELLNAGAGGRYYAEAQRLLYNLYVARGDAFAAQNEFCPAAIQYQNAVRVLPSGVANGKLQTANAFCANATPTPDPFAPPPFEGTPIPGFAPVGQPGT